MGRVLETARSTATDLAYSTCEVMITFFTTLILDADESTFLQLTRIQPKVAGNGQRCRNDY